MRFQLLLLTLLPLLAASCRSVGSPQIYEDRIDYNEAIVRTRSEELLLNTVRLRYRDTPFFLQVGSVSTQFEWSGSLGLSSDYGRSGGFTGADGALGMRIASRPTVTYQPLQGETFVRQLLSPIQLEHMLLLYHSGWSVRRILSCCTQAMNGIANAPSASGPTPEYEPTFEEFAELAAELRALQCTGGIELGAVEREGRRFLRLAFTPQAEEAAAERVREALGLDAGATEFELVAGAASLAGSERIAINARSLLGVLFFLSQCVEVPDEDIEDGLVTVTRDDGGGAFDWQRVAGGFAHDKL